VPRYQSYVIYRIDDGSLKMCHHLEIIIVLNIVALNNGDLPIDNHEFGMKGSEKWSVVIDYFHIDVWDISRCWKSDRSGRVSRRWNVLVMIVHLKKSANIGGIQGRIA
jgi:hypothetical protein